MKPTILLVEPEHPIHYPNLALMKFSAHYKKLNYQTQYVWGNDANAGAPEEIIISTLFTYYAKRTVECINFYCDHYPKAKVRVGGIFATLMPGYIEEQTGIKPEVGPIDWLDRTPPDYDLMDTMCGQSKFVNKWRDFSILFSSRGCAKRCAFCAVGRLEPKREIIDNWRDLIDLRRPSVMFQDNNLTAVDMSHFREVMEFLAAKKLRTCFNNGFDARLLTDEHIDLLAKVKWNREGLRLAFDDMSQDGYVQRAISKLLAKGMPTYCFTVFCLFNFNDTFEEAMYRHREVANLGVRPVAQPYMPLDLLDKRRRPISAGWTKELAYEFGQYWFRANHYKKMTFDEYLRSIGKSRRQLLEKQ